MLQLNVVVDQSKGWIDYATALGAAGTVVAAVAALIAVKVTRSIARKQLDLQERQLRNDLYDRRFAVFADTGNFLRPILSTPTGFTPQSDAYRQFGETAQNAEMLFGPEVRKYIEDVSRTAVNLWASYQKMAKDPADNDAIEEQAKQFQHLSDLWQKRPDVFRRDMSLG
jgi:hypothetical protein